MSHPRILLLSIALFAPAAVCRRIVMLIAQNEAAVLDEPLPKSQDGAR